MRISRAFGMRRKQEKKAAPFSVAEERRDPRTHLPLFEFVSATGTKLPEATGSGGSGVGGGVGGGAWRIQMRQAVKSEGGEAAT